MTLREYVLQIRAHRRRVRLFGQACLVPWSPARILCRWHDVEKWLFLPWLFKYRCGRGDRAAAARVYERMNAIGRAIERMLLLPYTPPQRDASRSLVRVIDCLDRSLDPVARVELGDAENPPPIGAFLSFPEEALAKALAPQWTAAFGREVEQNQWMTDVVTRDAWRRAWERERR